MVEAKEVVGLGTRFGALRTSDEGTSGFQGEIRSSLNAAMADGVARGRRSEDPAKPTENHDSSPKPDTIWLSNYMGGRGKQPKALKKTNRGARGGGQGKRKKLKSNSNEIKKQRPHRDN